MSGGGPPGSIPNPAVKPASADGSMGFGPCESRPLPTGSLFICLVVPPALPACCNLAKFLLLGYTRRHALPRHQGDPRRAAGVYRPSSALVDGGTVGMDKVAAVNLTFTGTTGGPVGQAGQRSSRGERSRGTAALSPCARTPTPTCGRSPAPTW